MRVKMSKQPPPAPTARAVGPCPTLIQRGGRVVRWCWVNFRCWGDLLIWIIVGQGPTALVVGAGGGCLQIFLSSVTSFLSPSNWETARYRLKYCLKGPLSQKQPTNQLLLISPRTTNLWRGYRVCPVRMYVSTYVRSFVRMFTRSSDLIYYPISI